MYPKNLIITLVALATVIVVLTSADSSRAKQSGLLQIDQLRKVFLRLEDELYTTVGSNTMEISNEISKNSVPLDLVLIRKLQGFDIKLNQEFPHDINYGLDVLQNSWVWARANAELRTMFAMYEAFRRFQAQQTAEGRIPAPRQAWIDLAETILHDSKASMPNTLQKLHDLKIKENLFLNALREIDGGTQCSMRGSPQQMLLNLYNSVAATELKAYTMIQFSYMLLKLYGKGNFTHEAELTKDRFIQRTTETINSMRDALDRASRKLWICDPKKYEKDKNYIEITELLQGYVQNEVDLNQDGTCRENCAEYKYTKSHSCYMNLYCKQQRRCQGKIINCQFIDSDAWICPAAKGTNRRYEYIEYENGRVLGRKKDCARGSTKVDSWWRWLFWHCSYCVCLCDEQGTNSDRYINMQPSLVDIKNNRVATGLRFTKIGRVIHLQIQEGELLKGGKINENTVRWVPINAYNITDKNVHNGKDFHTLTFESRALDLDDLEEKNQDALLTGVRFEMIGSHMNFQIYLTPFDFTTGKLQPEKSYWKSNHNTDAATINPRRKLDLDGRDIPTRQLAPSQPDSQSDSYLEFTNTDLDRDVAQTTIPFFDSQNVDSQIPVPLSGAGIYHKGLSSFGGFVAPKIITYDYTKLLDNAYNDLELNPDILVN